MMCLMKITLFFLLVPLVQAHKDCTQQVQWENLLFQLNNLSHKISQACSHHYVKASLCDPRQMLDKMELGAEVLVDIMRKAESIYMKDTRSHKFVAELTHAQATLTTCVHKSHDAHHEHVAACFDKLESFLNDKKSHSQCAWEIVNDKIREILQRLENTTVRRRRSAHSRVAEQEN